MFKITLAALVLSFVLVGGCAMSDQDRVTLNDYVISARAQADVADQEGHTQTANHLRASASAAEAAANSDTGDYGQIGQVLGSYLPPPFNLLAAPVAVALGGFLKNKETSGLLNTVVTSLEAAGGVTNEQSAALDKIMTPSQKRNIRIRKAKA